MLATHPDGSVVTRHWYDVWGAVRPGGSAGWGPVTGQGFNEFEASDYSKLLYAGSRYYHPKTRRFLTPDDRLVPGGAQGFNRYLYATNNPPSFREDGHQGEPVAQATPGSASAPGTNWTGWASTALATAAVFGDVLKDASAANLYSLATFAASMAIVAVLPNSSPDQVSTYFGAIALGSSFGGYTFGSFVSVGLGGLPLAPSGIEGTGALLTRLLGLSTTGLANGLVAFQVGVINWRLFELTYEALARTQGRIVHELQDPVSGIATQSQYGCGPIDP
jgi:RHS repeat-associated protein